MDHTPSESAKCYSEAGYAGSSTSNLYIRYPYEMDGEPLYTHATDSVRGWLIDEGVYGLGHRRWMLDPFLQKISYGQVDGIPGGYDAGYMAYGATIKVIYEERDLQLPITAGTLWHQLVLVIFSCL